jgi:beta-glucanase (GH16 family)
VVAALLVALTAVSACTDTQVATEEVPVPKGYLLAWHDEFNGSELGDGWNAEHSTYGSGNDELQCYSPDNLEVADGTLRLTAIEEDARCRHGKTRPYSSGMVRSEGAWTYGRFEVRARVPKGAGMLPAVWMLSRNRPFGTGGRSGELDLMEVNTDDVRAVLASMHWTHEACGPGCSKQSTVYELSGLDAADFHTYRLDWAPEEIVFRVDGAVVLRTGSGEQLSWSSAAEQPSPQSATFPAPFSPPNEMYLLMNLAVGGNFVGVPPASTQFPATMEVDYVRVYQHR